MPYTFVSFFQIKAREQKQKDGWNSYEQCIFLRIQFLRRMIGTSNIYTSFFATSAFFKYFWHFFLRLTFFYFFYYFLLFFIIFYYFL